MSDYHIQIQDKSKKSVSVVFHVPILATGKNAADITWRQAVVLEQGGSGNIVSILPGVSAPEDTQLKAGELLEVTQTVKFKNISQTLAQRKTTIEEFFNKLKSDLVSEKQVTLEWMGYEGSVS